MQIKKLTIQALAIAALVLATGPTAMALHDRPAPERDSECLAECRDLRRGCHRACRAAFGDCMSGPRVEMRICRYRCSTEFEADSPELEACVLGCREEILAPALEECRSARRDCVKRCYPGYCWRICRPDGPGVDDVDRCSGECADTLRSCSRDDHIVLHECLQPCRETVDTEEALDCAATCADAAVGNAALCSDDYVGCTDACEPTTTSTLPLE